MFNALLRSTAPSIWRSNHAQAGTPYSVWNDVHLRKFAAAGQFSVRGRNDEAISLGRPDD
jgi:hypothetical protein